MDRFGRLLARLLRLLLGLCALGLVLLALYVSLGRQLAPLVAGSVAMMPQRQTSEPMDRGWAGQSAWTLSDSNPGATEQSEPSVFCPFQLTCW